MMTEHLFTVKHVDVNIGWMEAMDALESISKTIDPSELRSNHIRRLEKVTNAFREKFIESCGSRRYGSERYGTLPDGIP